MKLVSAAQIVAVMSLIAHGVPSQAQEPAERLAVYDHAAPSPMPDMALRPNVDTPAPAPEAEEPDLIPRARMKALLMFLGSTSGHAKLSLFMR